jgi:hypothetical protein
METYFLMALWVPSFFMDCKFRCFHHFPHLFYRTAEQADNMAEVEGRLSGVAGGGGDRCNMYSVSAG